MAWNGSGQFTRDNGANSGSDVWQQDKGDGTKILASLHDVHDEDIATGLENCLTRDGQNTPSADLPMGTRKHTGVGDASAVTHYSSAGQIVRGQLLYGGTSSGASGTYAVTLAISPILYVTGMEISFISHQDAAVSNTLNVNGIGAVAIHDPAGATTSGSIRNGDYVRVRYDGSVWQMINVYGVRQRGYTPALTPYASMTISSTSVVRGAYGISYSGVSLDIGVTFTVGGTPSDIVYITIPTAAASATPTALSCAVWGGSGYHSCVATVASSTLEVRKLDGNFTAGTLRGIYVSGTYPKA